MFKFDTGKVNFTVDFSLSYKLDWLVIHFPVYILICFLWYIRPESLIELFKKTFWILYPEADAFQWVSDG